MQYDSSRQRTPSLEKKLIAQGVRQFFEKNYELRYNILKQVEEFRPRRGKEATCSAEEATNSAEEATNSAEEATNFCEEPTNSAEKATNSTGKATQWRQLTERELRRIVIEQMEQVGVAWSVDVELYVRSSIVSDYNPIADYLSHCGTWDGRDRIRPLARRVPCPCDRWAEWFHRWFLAMVAQWQQRSRDYGNAMVPMLIGGQGTHKSTFCRLLLPPALREYYIDDVKLDSAEQVERMLGRMLLVNIDEYNAKTEREQAKIKRVLTERDVQTRKMRSDQYLMRPRMASFIATTNDTQPLTDPTGSRRYLCCEVTGVIDTDTPIDYCQLYAQAVAELQRGHRWHFTKAEEAAIMQHNRHYCLTSSAEAVLLAYFKPAVRSKEFFMRAVDIQQVLRQHLRPADVPNIKKLTLTLKACGFAHGSYQDYRGWYAQPVQKAKENGNKAENPLTVSEL